jgi:hypothetical protein
MGTAMRRPGLSISLALLAVSLAVVACITACGTEVTIVVPARGDGGSGGGSDGASDVGRHDEATARCGSAGEACCGTACVYGLTCGGGGVCIAITSGDSGADGTPAMDATPDEGGADAGGDARAPDAASDAESDSGPTMLDASDDVAEASPPACSPGCPDGNECVEDRDCASSSCVDGFCAFSVACGSTCAAGATCISEAAPVVGEGQSCPIDCGGGSTIATVTTVYATNCNPTPCPSSVSACPGETSCDVILDNAICGGDPCPSVPKGWSVTVTCADYDM